MIKVLGLAGRAGVGKNHYAKAIQSVLWSKDATTEVIVRGFGDTLTQDIFLGVMKQHEAIKTDPKVRTFFQDLGDIGRKYDEYIWVTLWWGKILEELSTINDHDKKNYVVIVPGVRTPTEVDFINNLYQEWELTSSIVKLEIKSNYELTKENKKHNSEDGVDDISNDNYSYVIYRPERPTQKEVLADATYIVDHFLEGDSES